MPESIINKAVLMRSLITTTSTFGKNLTDCCSALGITVESVLNNKNFKSSVHEECKNKCVTISDRCTAKAVMDLCSMRDQLVMSNFDFNEINKFIEFLCLE